MKESWCRVDTDFLRLWSSNGQSLTKPVNSRIRTAKYNNKKSKIKLNIIQCYAPINDTDDKKKGPFNQQLQAVLNKAGKKDMTILMGNFKSKVGADDTHYDEVIGTQGLGSLKENGKRFSNLCSLNHIVIRGSIYS